MDKFSKYLRGDEELWRLYRRHVLSYTIGWFFGVILLAAAFFLLWPLLSQGNWGLIGFGVLLLSGIVILWRTIKLWRGNMVLITSRQVIDVSREGFFGEAVSQVPYANMQDISWSRQGFWAVIFRYGTVQLVASNGTVRLLFPYLPHPQQVVNYIISMHKKTVVQDKFDKSIKNKLGNNES